MKTGHHVLPPLAVGLAFAFAVLPASANTMTQVLTYGAPGPGAPPALDILDDFPFSLSFNKFDTGLGTLTGITIKLSSTDNLESDVYNMYSKAKTYSGATAVATVTIRGPDGTTTSVTLTAGPFHGTAVPGVNIAGTVTQGGSSSAPVPSGLFGLYSGLGGGTATLHATAAGTDYGDFGSVFFGGSASTYGTVEIDYTYTAVADTGAGLAGLGAVLGLCGLDLTRCVRRSPF